MTDELKPCPFCGDSGVTTMNEGSTFRWRYLSCNSCGATPGEVRVQTFGDGTPDEWEKQAAKDAIAAWNRRAQPAVPAEQEISAEEKFCDGHCSWAEHHPDCSLAAPPAQPVAHLWQHGETGRTRIVMPDQIFTADANWLLVGPMYLHPTAAPAVSWRDHVEQRLHSWRSTTMNEDGDCVSLSDYLNWETMDDLIDFVCDESVGPDATDAGLHAWRLGETPPAAPADAAPSVAPEPVAWTLQSELDAAQTTCSAHLWFTNPRNSAWTALFTREQIAAHPPRAPLTEEIESADNLLRHLGLDPERCRTVGGSLNVSRIKTLLADAAPTARESAMEELLRSAAAIAQRHGAGTAWDRFGASIKALGIGAITARTYRLLPSDTERQQPPTTDPSRLADDLSNIGTMSPRIRKLYDDAAAFIRSTQAPLAPWQSMKTAPKDGAAVLVLLDASDIPHAARWLSGPDDRRATEETTRAGWHLTWDGSPIEEHDGPRYWMHCPDDPDESDIEAAHGIGGKE